MLGFDGVDPRWLGNWAKQGKLPTLQRLIEQAGGSGYHPLGTTNPPQSPVAWASFATGTQPGDHGIFDFIARTINSSPSGLPIALRVATSTFDPQPVGPPVARNLRSGTPFWQALGNQGVRVIALNVPYSFPPEPTKDGRILSGLGVPDLRETNSTFTYAGRDVTDADLKHPPGGGVLVKLSLRAGVARFDLEGPSNPEKLSTRLRLPVEVRPQAATLEVGLAGKRYELPLQRWSDLIEVDFVHGTQHFHGLLRMLALEAGERARLFVSPISFNPRDPYAPISYPRAFAAQLADAIGHDYKTVGWDHDTSALNAEVIDDAAFLQDMDAIERDRKAMLMTQLARPDWDLLIWVSTATDRVSHMFYRLLDPEHPRYDPVDAERFGNAIEHEYERMDATVSDVVAQLHPEDTLLILSDHGFHEFRRGLNVNRWLLSQGLLTLQGGERSAEREFLIDVDWTKTKAYAVGTGQVYLNRKGRERHGIVTDAQAKPLLENIRNGLRALRDRQRGDAEVVRNVYLAQDVFRGRRAAEAPDLQIAFAENYRTSWETILGGVPKELFVDNDKKWSGDHAASDVADTPGIVLANRPLANGDPQIVDFAPTAHVFFGRSIPPAYVGKPLFGEGKP
jgi:predicted AlkP superfamily phosphohydrolase/phosphomutase